VAWAVPLWLPRVQSKILIGLSAVLLYPLLASYLFLGGGKGVVWTALMALGLAAFARVWLTALAEMRTGLGFGALMARLIGGSAASEARLRRIGQAVLLTP
jgi:general L-amino acid transport system permease protein